MRSLIFFSGLHFQAKNLNNRFTYKTNYTNEKNQNF